MVFRKTSKLNNTVGMKKTRRKNRYKHTKRNTKIYVVRPLAYIHGLQQEKISLINIENTKWCGSILTKPNPNTPKIILSYKQKFSLSIQRIGLNTKFETAPKTRRSFRFSKIAAQPPSHSPLQRDLPISATRLHPNSQTSHTNHIYLIKRKTK